MTCHAARRVGEFERRLSRERCEIWRALTSTDAELAGLERHQPGEFVNDAARETAQRLLSNLEERDRHVLTEIDAAEERLFVGTFGACEDPHQALACGHGPAADPVLEHQGTPPGRATHAAPP